MSKITAFKLQCHGSDNQMVSGLARTKPKPRSPWQAQREGWLGRYEIGLAVTANILHAEGKSPNWVQICQLTGQEFAEAKRKLCELCDNMDVDINNPVFQTYWNNDFGFHTWKRESLASTAELLQKYPMPQTQPLMLELSRPGYLGCLVKTPTKLVGVINGLEWNTVLDTPSRYLIEILMAELKKEVVFATVRPLIHHVSVWIEDGKVVPGGRTEYENGLVNASQVDVGDRYKATHLYGVYAAVKEDTAELKDQVEEWKEYLDDICIFQSNWKKRLRPQAKLDSIIQKYDLK